MRALMIGLAIGLVAALAWPRPRDGLALVVACEAGDAGACDEAAPYARRYGDYEVFELDAGCVIRRSAFACEEVAEALHGDGDDAPDRALAGARMARAAALYRAACFTGAADACLGASRAYAAGYGVAWDLRRARSFEARACALGSEVGCEAAGDHARGGEAISDYRAACAGLPHACVKLARAEAASGAPREAVVASYRRACAALAFDACDVLRTLDRERPPELARAFARWCEVEPRGCEAP